MADVTLAPDELARIAAAPPVERDEGLAAGRRVYLMEWERDALLADLAAAKAMLAEVQWAASEWPENSECPVCSGEAHLENVGEDIGQWEQVGQHHDGCALAALL